MEAAREEGSNGSSLEPRAKLTAFSMDVRELGDAVSTERSVSPRERPVGIVEGKLDCD